MTAPVTRRAILWGLGAGALAAGLPLPGGAQEDAPPPNPVETDIVIIGAGLSGLYAALLLERRGIRVAVLEAGDRVGGRCRTLDDLPGHPEAGAAQIGAACDRVLALCRDLGVGLAPLLAPPPGLAIRLGGLWTDLPRWAASPLNPGLGRERGFSPAALLDALAGPANPLSDPARTLASGATKYDIPLDNYLKLHGVSDGALGLIAQERPDPHTLSALAQLQRMAWNRRNRRAGPPLRVLGGTSRLIEALAGALKTEIRLNSPAAAILQNERAVLVTTAGGTAWTAKRAVLAAPFAALRNIQIWPQLQGRQGEALAGLDMNPVMVALFRPLSPFWERDKMPAALWSDTPLGALYPVPTAETGLPYLMARVQGEALAQILPLAPDIRPKALLAMLTELRPSARDQVELAALADWAENPFIPGGGARWRPGQIERLGRDIARPAGRLHFCGDQTAFGSAGLEAALESAQRAANEIPAIL